MKFWTKEEYMRFAEEMMEDPQAYYCFEVLYWSGIRLGELLALNLEDLDIRKRTLKISKTYQRIHGRDVITDPKTPQSNRVIKLPMFLCEELLRLSATTGASEDLLELIRVVVDICGDMKSVKGADLL